MDCPVSSDYALLIADDVAERGQGTVGFLTINLRGSSSGDVWTADDELRERLTDMFNQQLIRERLEQPISSKMVQDALQAAEAEQSSYEQQLQRKADEVLKQLRQEGKKGVVWPGIPITSIPVSATE